MTWKSELKTIIIDHWSVGEEFTVRELYQQAESLGQNHPENRNPQAKIRQALQGLRRESVIELARGVGTYRRRA